MTSQCNMYKLHKLLVFLFLLKIVNGFELTLIHTNDVHSRFEEINAYGAPCNDATSATCFGGVARRITKIKELRQTYKNTLLLDAGDQYQGTMWFYVHKGKATAHFMEEARYDAMAVGNHEFDEGVDDFLRLLNTPNLSVLSSNIDISKEPKLAGKLQKSKVFTIKTEKIGVIGYTSQETPQISSPGPTLSFTDEVTAIREQVKILKDAGVKIIIALGHSGFHVDKKIAEEVEGIDVVVGGLTNTFLYTGAKPSNDVPASTYPHVVTQKNGAEVLVVQDYAFGKYIGVLNLEFDTQGKIVKYSGNPVLLDNTVKKDSDTVDDMKKNWLTKILEARKKVIGKSHVLLDGKTEVCRKYECNLGNLITDAMVHQLLKQPDNLHWTNDPIALVNSGAIRMSINQGDITLENILNVLPFRNTVDSVELKGKHLLEVLEHSVSTYGTGKLSGGFMQFSGLFVKFNVSQPVGRRVVSVDVRCSKCIVPDYTPLVKEQIYRILMSSFIINGGDNYKMIKKNLIKRRILGELTSEVTLEYVKLISPIMTGIERRMSFVDASIQTGKSSLTEYSAICISVLIISHFIT